MKRAPALVLGLACAIVPGAASAKVSCYPLAQIERALDTEYGETRHFAGSEETGIEYRLYVNAKKGTWSWIGIPKGTEVGCLIFAGRSEPASPAQPAAPPQAHF
jgi:hypothetical protein